MRPRFDDRDARIVAERCAEWEQRDGPRVGDFIQRKDGSLRRFSCSHGDVLQTALPEAGSYHLHPGMDFSGTHCLEGALSKSSLQRLPFSRKGSCWIFHHGEVKPGNRVDTEVNCRVYMEV